MQAYISSPLDLVEAVCTCLPCGYVAHADHVHMWLKLCMYCQAAEDYSSHEHCVANAVHDQ